MEGKTGSLPEAIHPAAKVSPDGAADIALNWNILRTIATKNENLTTSTK